MGPTPSYLQSQVVSACQSFRPLAPFLFLVKDPFLVLYFLIKKGVWTYRHVYGVPLVTLILNTYGVPGLLLDLVALKFQLFL